MFLWRLYSGYVSTEYLFWLDIWSAQLSEGTCTIRSLSVSLCATASSFSWLGHFSMSIDHKTVLTAEMYWAKIHIQDQIQQPYSTSKLLYWETVKCARILFATANVFRFFLNGFFFVWPISNKQPPPPPTPPTPTRERKNTNSTVIESAQKWANALMKSK